MNKYQGLMGEIFKGTFFAILLAAQVIGLSWLTWVETVLIMLACLALDKLVSMAFKNAGSKDE